MTQIPEKEEQQRLKHVKAELVEAIKHIDKRLNAYQQDIDYQKHYLWENRDEMDHVEKAFTRDSIQQQVTSGDFLLTQRKRFNRIAQSPYFARIDFKSNSSKNCQNIYIGVHHFQKDGAKEALIYDWRSPIASLFYDYETGEAQYQAPEGNITGQITLKRQFRIEQGQIKRLIESELNIVDELLQQTLSESSEPGMKNIVATIQRDQNAIIRNSDAQTLVIQGVAGSGKTSIALHRIAYLLYQFKDTLSAQDILILSPNRVFADYISQVLPELGEENVPELMIETLAETLLNYQYKFETFFEQNARLVEKKQADLAERIEFKADRSFLKKLDQYAGWIEQNRFQAQDIWLGRGKLIPDWFLEETYQSGRQQPIKEQIKRMVKACDMQVAKHYRYNVTTKDLQKLREAISAMFTDKPLKTHYQAFFNWLERPDMIKSAGRGRLEYNDVFPLIYLKMRLEKVNNPYQSVRHLLIDEMQDLTQVQYAVLGQLFRCSKTILGDVMQSINPHSSSNQTHIKDVFKQANCVKLTKSYRSTWPIVQLAQAIQHNPDLEAMRRDGSLPQVIGCKTPTQQTQAIIKAIHDFEQRDQTTFAILCKTPKQAQKLHKTLSEHVKVQLLNEQSQHFKPGVLITCAQLAKGLEFDQAWIVDVSQSNYQDEMDRNLLYVAITRAMHQLTLSYTGQISAMLPTKDLALFNAA